MPRRKDHGSAPGPPRLVLLTTGFFDRGGVATRSRTLARGFAQRGWDVRVITRGAINAPVREPLPPRVRVLELPVPPGALGSALYLASASVVALAWGMRARAFLAMQLLSPTTVASVCSLLLGKPFVSLTSMTGELSEVRTISRSRFAGLRVALLHRARCAVAQSELGAQELRELLPADRVAVVVTPTDAVPASTADRVGGSVLYAGRLAEEKGILELLEAWAAVATTLPHARLALVGGGGRDRSVEERVHAQAAQEPLRNSVELVGWADDVGERLSRCDVFVLPSHTEGMSNALVEAVMRGCVVVASRIPGNTAVLGEAYPLLFRPRDADDLATALLAALTDERIRASAVESVRAQARRFETPTVVEALERLLSGTRG